MKHKNKKPGFVWMQWLGAVWNCFYLIENYLNINKMAKIDKTENVEQLFQDDPWLMPFEGEIRRR